jgi:hypothetical protein
MQWHEIPQQISAHAPPCPAKGVPYGLQKKFRRATKGAQTGNKRGSKGLQQASIQVVEELKRAYLRQGRLAPCDRGPLASDGLSDAGGREVDPRGGASHRDGGLGQAEDVRHSRHHLAALLVRHVQHPREATLRNAPPACRAPSRPHLD